MTSVNAVDGSLDRPALRCERTNAAPIEYAIWPERPVTIGREPTNTIAVDSPFVSKAHAVFRYTDGGYLLEDLGSANGTRVNGVSVSRTVVAAGDVIEIGDERLVFTDRAAALTPAARRGLGKSAKLAVAVGATATLLTMLFGLLWSISPILQIGTEAPNLEFGTRPEEIAPVALSGSESLATQGVVERAQRSGVMPVDALIDEGMLDYRVGRLRESAELFAAALVRDPQNERVRGRLQATNAALARTIESDASEAERALSQLRIEDAAAAWERVILLTDMHDPRHDRAEKGIQLARSRRMAR